MYKVLLCKFYVLWQKLRDPASFCMYCVHSFPMFADFQQKQTPGVTENERMPTYLKTTTKNEGHSFRNISVVLLKPVFLSVFEVSKTFGRNDLSSLFHRMNYFTYSRTYKLRQTETYVLRESKGTL